MVSTYYISVTIVTSAAGSDNWNVTDQPAFMNCHVFIFHSRKLDVIVQRNIDLSGKMIKQ